MIAVSAFTAPAAAQSINEDIKITASDAARDDQFGHSIAIKQGIVVVGARLDDDALENSGSVYLFDALTNVQLAKLTASDAAANDLFGHSVAIYQGIVAVGAIYDDDHGNSSGSVYLFDADPASPTFGTQLHKLTASDADSGDIFGISVAMNQGILAVGATNNQDHGIQSGSAYLFDVQTGIQLAKLTASDASAVDNFGNSIAIAQGIVAVGARLDDNVLENSGSVYLFDADPSSKTFGTQLSKLTASDADAGDFFGYSVSIDQGIVGIGAYLNDDDGTGSGSAYLFDADPASPTFGTQLSKVTADDATASDFFGFSVAIDQGTLTVGAVGDANSGSAYLFNADPASTTFGAQLGKLVASDAARNDGFGSFISINNGTVIVGAKGDDDSGLDSGSAYLFDINCAPDLNGDGTLNFFDISAFLSLYMANDLAVDFNGDHTLNFFDISMFLAELRQGCSIGQ